MKTHNEILDMWPSYRSVSMDVGVSYSLVRMWVLRGNIPAANWKRLVDAARDRDLPVTYKMLAEAVAA